MEQWKTDEYYRNMIIWNVIEKRIKLLQIYIEDITWEKIKIWNAEINKANYDEFKNKTIQIDKTNWINMFWELDKLLKNSTINFLYSKQQFKQLFSKELIKIIDNKDPQSQTIKSSLQRTPYLTWDKWFENKTVKLINWKTINIKEIYEQYDYLYEDFTKKNDLFIFWNKQNKWSKKWFWLNDAKFKRWYKEIENVYQEKLQNIENFSVTELVIMLRVLFSVLPIAWDTLWWYDDLNQALAKINFDWSMQWLWENVFMYAISWLQLTFVWWWFAKLTKWPKLTKAMINITKIINKLSNNPKMLNDISKNNKVMQILENMRGKMPWIESFLEKIKSTKINKSLQKSKPTQNYTPKFLPKNPERKNLEIILSNIIKSPEWIKILENILNINLPKLWIKKYLSEINIAQKISLWVMSTGLISLFLCIYWEDCVEDIEKIWFKIFGYTWFEFSEKIKQIKQLPQEQRDVILKWITKEISKQIIMAYAFEKFKKEFNANPKLNFMDYCIKNWYIKKYEELWEFAFETLNSEIYNSLDKYRERYFYIREYYNKFNWNPHEMIKDLYWVQTKWDIKVELEWASIIFAFNKPEDYQKIEGSNSKSQSWWFNNPNKLMWWFIAINKSVCWPTTKIHELQHSEDYLIFDYNWPISSLKTEIIARIKDWMNKKYSISQLTNEKWFYNYYKWLKESSPTEYKEKWSNHIKLAEYYIEIAFLVKIKYPDNANFILSFTNIEDWEKLIIDKII